MTVEYLFFLLFITYEFCVMLMNIYLISFKLNLYIMLLLACCYEVAGVF